MNSRDIRSFSLHSSSQGSFGKVREKRRWVRWFTQRVGRALGTGRSTSHVEHLESRQLLEGSFLAPLTLPAANSAGVISSAQAINPAQPSTNNDTFTWTATTSGFVSVLADTSNESNFALNTAVRVYNSSQQLIASGNDNGTLTSGLQPDGWASFIAVAGEQYFFQVSSETSASGPYSLRVHTTNAAFSIGEDGDPPSGVATQFGLDPAQQRAVLGQLGGTGPIANRLRQDEIIYRWDVGNDDIWDGLVTVNAQSTQTNLDNRLDTRMEVYNAAGALVTSNSDTGNLNDAFVAFRATPGDTFYIRVRSDSVLNRVTPSQNAFNLQKSTGPFFLVMDAVADAIPLNRVTRRGGVPSGALAGFNQSAPPPSPVMGAPVFDTSLFEFEVVGNGRAFISVTPTGLDPIADPAVRIYNSAGVQVGYNDNFNGLNAQVEVQLIGGDRYFIVVDNFQERSGTQFALWIETQHTFDAGVDDHANSPTNPTAPATPLLSELERQQATPLNFGNPFLTFDSDNNPVRDRGLRQTAVSGGRLYDSGDRDIFMFTAPWDMLDTYAGNDDDQGNALYIGGAFDHADLNTPFPVNSRNLTIWDAADYWYTGRQDFDADFGVFYGFRDNPATAGTGRAEVYASWSWDDDNDTQTPDVLVVGGDFELVIPSPFGPVIMTNLAAWRFNATAGKYQWSNELGDTNGPVRAFAEFSGTTFDPDGNDGPATQLPDIDGDVPLLYMGGSFTTVNGAPAPALARFNGGWERVIGAGDFAADLVVSGEVYALAVYNPPDSGDGREDQPDNDPPLGEVLDPPDAPLSLWIGGKLTVNATVWPVNEQNALWAFNGHFFDLPTSGTPWPPYAIRKGLQTGTVYSLQVFTDPDPDDNGPAEEQQVLIIGGDFDSAGGITANNIVQWGRVDITQDIEAETYEPQLLWEAFVDDTGQQLNDPVRAMTVWQRPRINLEQVDPVPLLVFGGEFFGLDTGGANLSDFIAGWTGEDLNYLGGFDAPVRALAVTADAQEPGIEDALDSGVSNQQVLYAGGDFTLATNNGLQFIPANHVAMRSATTGPLFPDDGFTWSALNGGVEYADADLAPASVFSLTVFDDGIDGQYDRHDKPATRLSIAAAGIENSFINARVRVYDSRGTLVYGFDRPGSETIDPTAPDPAGMVDPSTSTPDRNTELDGIQVWGGEVYYIEVSDYAGSDENPTDRGGTGRYSITVTTDAGLVDWDGNGTKEDIVAIPSQSFEEPDEGDFANAMRLVTPLATGDVDLTVNSSQPPPVFSGRNFITRRVSPFRGGVQLGGDLGLINSLEDTDLYTFEAQYTGTVELRVSTLFLADQFGELDSGFAGSNKTYNSRLDAALRVFRNDFTQVAYNDDSATVKVEGLSGSNTWQFLGDQVDVGSITGVFGQKDPRVVINVVAGDRYYIQVESAQRYKIGDRTLPPDGNDPDNPDRRVENIEREIDNRDAIGSYNLIVNQLPRLNSGFEGGFPVQDDHPNFAQGLSQGSPVLINEDIGNPLNGRGTASGVIDNFGSPVQVDNDVFRLFAIGNGQMSVRLTKPAGSTLNGRMFLLNPTNGTALATSAAQNDGSALLTFTVIQGQELILYVEGQGGSEGAYNLAFTLPPQVDDYADTYKWWNAQDLPLFDFQGQGSVTGNIERTGDSDVFRVQFPFSENVTFNVTQQDTTLDPTVTIYEVMEDEVGKPYIKRVAFNDNVAPGNPNSQTSWGLYNDRTVIPATGPERTYPYYYIVVQSADPLGGTGRYTLTATFPQTDDHPDGDPDRDNVYDTAEFSLATPLQLDPLLGDGTQTGSIEVLDDDDLFTMVVPASGTVSFSVSNNTALGSIIRPRITVLDNNANILAQDTGDDTSVSTASVTLTAARGTRLFVVIEGFNNPDSVNLVATDTGAYILTFQAPPVDDHANATEWNIATAIGFNSTTGRGQIGGNAGNDVGNARINPAGDTDLFTFTVLRTGAHTVTITPFNADSGNLATRVRIFSSANLTTPIADDSSDAVAGAVIFDLGTVNIGSVFYILVEAISLSGSTDVGEYNVVVQGPAGTGGGGGGGTDPSAIDFNNPTVIVLNSRDGNGTSLNTTNSQTPEISPATDRDLYSFTTIAPGVVFVRISTPQGSLLDASVEVLRRNPNNSSQFIRVAFDQDGTAGSTANTSFSSAAGIEYFILVDGLGDSTGSYLVEVDTQPAVNRLVFPEGFATNVISEFVPIVNPNPFPINYTVRLRYDSGDLETVFPTRTIGANLRDGVTITRPDGDSFYSDFTVRQNVAYSVIIEWTIPDTVNGQPVDPSTIQPLGATMSHYDFGRSTGDAFTDKVSANWAFARVERDPGSVLDFFPVYNPHSFDIGMYIDVYLNDGTVVTLGDTDSQGNLAPRRVGAGRRSGFGLDEYSQLGRGVFSAVIRAEAFDSVNQPSFEGIVASLTHYRINQSAFAILGDASGGTTKGAVTNLTSGSGITSELTFFNPGTSPATVTITGNYVNATLPQFTRTVTLQPGRTTRVSGSSLGIVSGQTVGLKYTSNVPVYQLAFQERLGDADASTAQAAAGTRAYFGDAFINSASAGSLYFEWLHFYNPSGVTNNVTITLRFFDRVGQADQVRTINVSIPAGGFREVRLHESAAVLQRADGSASGPAFFGIEASSAQPFVSTLTHYDLFLGGGWGAAGVPFGIATPLTSI
ncbi:MAG TPA: hypothetical protein VHN77_06435 [Phycisphaerales bacterium]|nr:hypothetical protein [Phycisphaerales bacterium]